MSWARDFFGALPDAFSALWQFGGGLRGVFITLGSIAFAAVFLLAARLLRETRGWLSALFGVMGGTIVFWWVFGILPSAWVYFVDGSKDLLENRVIPGTLALGPDRVIAADFYQVFRDLVVVLETGVAIAACGVAALAVQKRYPRGLAEGEEPRPQSGGYK
ncbi:MAG: hypothetical protein M3276_08080 [Actinomycetota bacterium]|nr:hypothetical protein [Actinomycetota bacterium]